MWERPREKSGIAPNHSVYRPLHRPTHNFFNCISAPAFMGREHAEVWSANQRPIVSQAHRIASRMTADSAFATVGLFSATMSTHDLKALTETVVSHRDERDWKQFHTPKELAISLCVESAELLSLMQWKTGEQLSQTVTQKREMIQDELADVFHSLLLLSAELNIPLDRALTQKLKKDAQKYPVNKSKGKNLKYDEL